MAERQKTPAEQLKEFLDFIDRCHAEYQLAYDAVNKEDKRVQDFLHEIEFAQDKAERNRIATKLQGSRRERRRKE